MTFVAFVTSVAQDFDVPGDWSFNMFLGSDELGGRHQGQRSGASAAALAFSQAATPCASGRAAGRLPHGNSAGLGDDRHHCGGFCWLLAQVDAPRAAERQAPRHDTQTQAALAGG